MNEIENLRRQHQAVDEMAARMLAMIAAYRDEYDAVPILRLLRKLDALLRMHFAYEDWAVYPAMARHGDVHAAALARKLQSELGWISAAFEQFARRWSTCVAIAADFEAFSNEAAALLAALGARIERENDLLLPAAARIAAPGGVLRAHCG